MPDLEAILCSGQDGQHPARFDLVANCPEAEPIFAVAAGRARSGLCPQTKGAERLPSASNSTSIASWAPCPQAGTGGLTVRHPPSLRPPQDPDRDRRAPPLALADHDVAAPGPERAAEDGRARPLQADRLVDQGADGQQTRLPRRRLRQPTTRLALAPMGAKRGLGAASPPSDTPRRARNRPAGGRRNLTRRSPPGRAPRHRHRGRPRSLPRARRAPRSALYASTVARQPLRSPQVALPGALPSFTSVCTAPSGVAPTPAAAIDLYNDSGSLLVQATEVAQPRTFFMNTRRKPSSSSRATSS